MPAQDRFSTRLKMSPAIACDLHVRCTLHPQRGPPSSRQVGQPRAGSLSREVPRLSREKETNDARSRPEFANARQHDWRLQLYTPVAAPEGATLVKCVHLFTRLVGTKGRGRGGESGESRSANLSFGSSVEDESEEVSRARFA